MIYKFKKFLPEEECEYWIQRCPSFSDLQWKNRVIDISNEKIIKRVQNFLETKIKIKTTLNQAQLQLWPKNSCSTPHIHTYNGREDCDYNSLIYLNDDFVGGEFVTEHEKIIPEPGLLTFFNGREVLHGVNTVKYSHRYTMIFWWKNSYFL